MRYAQTIALAEALLAEGRASDVLRMLEPLALSPRPEATEDESEIQIRALMARARLLGSGDVEEAVRLLSPFRRFSDRARLSPETRGVVSLWLGWALAWHDARYQNPSLALGLLHEAEKIFINTRHTSGRCWVLLGQAQSYFSSDEYRLMRHALDQAALILPHTRDLLARTWSHDLEAVYARYRLAVNDARNHIAALHRLSKDHLQPLSMARAYAHEAALGVETGADPSAIVAAADQSLSLISDSGYRSDYALLTAIRARAQATLLQGDEQGFSSFLDRAEKSARGLAPAPAYIGLQRAWASVRRREFEDARQQVADVLAATNGSRHRIFATSALLLRAGIAIETGDYADASNALNEAHRKARLTGYRLHQARISLLMAQVAIREKGASRALQHLAEVDRLAEATSLLPVAAERFAVLAELAHLQNNDDDEFACRIQALSARRIMGDTAGIRKEMEHLDSIRHRVRNDAFPVASVLQRAAVHPLLVADAWLACLRRWHPFQWVAVFRTDADGRRAVLRETGRQPNDLPATSMHCEQCRAGAIDWIPISESGAASIHLAIAIPDEADYPALLARIRQWLPVAALAFHHAELNLDASHHCACHDQVEQQSEGPDACRTQSAAMEAVLAEVQRIKDGRSPVAIIGESGSGRTHLAGLMHQSSFRRHAPFIEYSFEDGGASAATESSAADGWHGAFRRAAGGTLVLKNIHRAPAGIQKRLARDLDLQAESSAPAARVVVLFSTDPERLLREGTLAEDLYDRLCGLVIRLPALRERREDIPLLARHFVRRFLTPGAPEPVITGPAMEALASYDWPGNIRQLCDELKQVVRSVGAEPLPAVTPADLSEDIRAVRGRRVPSRVSADGSELDDVLAGTEKTIIEETLRVHMGQVSVSAETLGLTRQGLYKKVKRLGIDLARFQQKPVEADA